VTHPTTTSWADDLRRAVSRTYARVSAPIAGTTLAGYSEEELARLPRGAADDFYGCGNPLSFASIRAGETVLDLGSGAGLDLILAAQAVGPSGRAVGVDMTDEMILRARKNVERAGLDNVEIRKGIIERLPVEDASVDWVISNCVISLSPEKEKVFREVARVLKPGGQMILSDLIVDRQLEWLLRWMVRVAPSLAFGRTEAHYLSVMAAAGLVDAEVKGRFVYEAEHLFAMFVDTLPDEGSACPVSSIASRLRQNVVTEKALLVAARQVAGHVWSTKLYARRPFA
jgi:SAM-dependent methyltransferase